MPDRRVIFVNRVYWPSEAATAQLLTDLAESLAARGWTVHVIAAGENSGQHNGVTIHRTGAGEQHGGLISRSRNYRRFQQRAKGVLTTLARTGDVVVLMTDPPMLGGAVTDTALRHGASVIHWIQDIYPEIVTAHVGAMAHWPLWPWRMRRDAAWRKARSCVTLCEDMRRTVADRGVPSAHIKLVSNWAPPDLHDRPNSTAVAAQRAAWGLTDKFVVAYSGNMGRVHSFAAVIEAAEILRANSTIVFLFVGTGARFDEVRAAAQTLRLENVQFLPPAPRAALRNSLAAADAHLVTLHPDFTRLVFPSKLAGVLAVGRPVLFVGSPESEIARLLSREECGVAVGAGDGVRLAETVQQWQTDPARQRLLGQQARKAYERRFTFGAALAQWEDLLRDAGTPA